MKIIFIPFMLLITSCSQYRYDVTYEKCNGQTGSLNYVWKISPFYCWPFRDGLCKNISYFPEISNVCDFYYTRNEIK